MKQKIAYYFLREGPRPPVGAMSEINLTKKN